MNICQLLGGNEDGGLENHVISLCNHFCHQHQLSLIAHPKYAPRLNKKVNFIPLPMDKGRRNPFLLWMLWRALRRLSPELIHAHGNKATALLAPLKTHLPSLCIATVHSLKKNVAMFEQMDGVIGVSEGVLAPIQHAAQQVIYNGVEPYKGPHYHKSELCEQWQLPSEQPLCIAVGRLVPVKAYDLLIKAWQTQNASLVIIGEGSEFSTLQQQINDSSLSHRIKLVGLRDDVAQILPAADLLAISSEREGFSLVMVESLLAGTPMVSTPVPGCREILPKAYLSASHESSDLAKTLSQALENNQALVDAYQPVFEFAQQQLTTQSMLEQTFAYYQRIRTGETL